MMRTPKQLLDGLGFVANTAVGLGRGLGLEAKRYIDGKINQKLQRMNLVSREEYEELRAMVAQLRHTQEEQAARFAEPASKPKSASKRETSAKN